MTRTSTLKHPKLKRYGHQLKANAKITTIVINFKAENNKSIQVLFLSSRDKDAIIMMTRRLSLTS